MLVSGSVIYERNYRSGTNISPPKAIFLFPRWDMCPFTSGVSSPPSTTVRPIGKNISVPPARREVFGGPGSGDPDGSPGHMSCFDTTGGGKTCPKKVPSTYLWFWFFQLRCCRFWFKFVAA